MANVNIEALNAEDGVAQFRVFIEDTYYVDHVWVDWETSSGYATLRYIDHIIVNFPPAIPGIHYTKCTGQAVFLNNVMEATVSIPLIGNSADRDLQFAVILTGSNIDIGINTAYFIMPPNRYVQRGDQYADRL